ncbi:MAG: flagellar motor switch phosphatase FliY [Oscillospiraceae bacterium]|nr:flagellar motor switch phosphatase FliY [Oscillospiraceae bacterium]
MSLSQDEINALLTTDGGDTAQAGSVDMTTSDDTAVAPDGVAKAAIAKENPEPVEIMSPEEIAAMLDKTGDAAATLDPGDGLANVLVKNGMLTDDEVDILGEVGNISMGAVATTMYSLLDRRVSITTPRVTVFSSKDVLSVYRIPFVVATIEYVEGITGTNLLVLKVEDAALITDLLMGGDGSVEAPIELNEIHLSAMSEIMNQMMGASSTSLSKLLRKSINISPPKSSMVDIGFDVSNLLGDIELVTKISFNMEIEGLLKSELIQLLPYELSREFARQFMEVGVSEPTDEDVKKAESPQVKAASPLPKQRAQPLRDSAAMPPPPVQAELSNAQQYSAPYQQTPYPPYQQTPYIQPIYAQSPYPQTQYPMAPPDQPTAAQSRFVDVHPMQFQAFDAHGQIGEQKGIDLIYNIPLQVTVELGKTKKEISEILEFSTGTIVVLDKIAGDPVEIVVNGKLIARGEVVVIDENYGVRITAIING